MKKFAFLLCGLLFMACESDDTTRVNFQGKINWIATHGGSSEDKTTSVVETPDGGVIVVGYTLSNDGDIVKTHDLYDVWVTRFDKTGNVVWSKTFGGSNNDYGYSIVKTHDNNYVIAGYSASSDFDVPRNLGMHDFYIFKIDGSGNLLWSKAYGFSNHDHAHKIIAMSDGGFFVAGFADYSGLSGQGGNGEGHTMNKATARNSNRHGVGEFFGIRLNSSGEFMWYRYYGGTLNDRVYDIAETEEGGVIMVGYTESQDFDVEGNKGSYDYWVVNLDKDGHLHWKKTYGGSDIDQAYGIVKTDFNSYLIVGQSNSTDGDVKKPLGNSDIWVIHINHHGDLLWEKSFGGSQFESASSIRKIGYNRYVVVGNSRSTDNGLTNQGQNDAYVFEIDARANSGMKWKKTFGGSSFDFATDATWTRDNKLIIVGDYQSNNGIFTVNKGMNDRFVLQME